MKQEKLFSLFRELVDLDVELAKMFLVRNHRQIVERIGKTAFGRLKKILKGEDSLFTVDEFEDLCYNSLDDALEYLDYNEENIKNNLGSEVYAQMKSFAIPLAIKRIQEEDDKVQYDLLYIK